MLRWVNLFYILQKWYGDSINYTQVLMKIIIIGFLFFYGTLLEAGADCISSMQDVLPPLGNETGSRLRQALYQDINEVRRLSGKNWPYRAYYNFANRQQFYAQYHRAIEAYFAKSYQSSLRLLNTVIEGLPEHANARYFRGLTYAQLNLFEEAILDLKEVSLHYPQEGLLSFHVGRAALFARYPKETIVHMNYAIDHHIFMANAYYYRGLAYYALGDIVGAYQDATKSVVWEPKNTEFIQLKAKLAWDLGDYSTAILDYTVALDFAPDNPELYLGRGLAYLYTERPFLAYEDFDSVIKLDMKTDLTYYFRGESAYRLGDMAQAIQDFSTAIQYLKAVNGDKGIDIIKKRYETANAFLKQSAAAVLDLNLRSKLNQ